MYHCNLRFYLTGQPCRAFEIIQEMPPLEHFSHKFMESRVPDGALAAEANVIIANLQNMDARKTVQELLLHEGQNSELILLADKSQIEALTDSLPKVKNVWTVPMGDAEVQFQFLRWQQAYKTGTDFWQASSFLEATINNVPNLIWYKDKNGIYKKVNDSFCKTVNKTRQQVEGHSHTYVWNIEQGDPAYMESDQQAMGRRETCVSEEVIETGTGMRTLTTYKSPLYDLDKSVMGIVGMAVDVTQEHTYKQEIMNKNRTLEMVFTALDCGVLCHSADGSRILSVNQAALNILGYGSQEELEEKGFDMVAATVVDEDKPLLRERIGELEKEGDSVSVEYRILHEDGRLLHVMGNIKLLKENGELFYQRFLLDITAQKLKEKMKDRRHEELVQALVIDYSLVWFFDLDTGMGDTIRNDDNGHLLDAAFSGKMSLEESMGLYIWKFVHEDDREMMQAASSREKLREELTGKKIYYTNYRAIKDGKVNYYQMTAVRAGEWDMNHGIVLGLHSVDEETRNEMEKKNLLKDALSQAKRASKAKSNFLSNMSHDIRTPMNAIVGFTTLAISHIEQKEKVEEYLKKIKTSGEHLLSLINDVLDMSRIESGKIHLEEKVCSLPEILHGLCNILQADVHAKQLELRIDTVDVFDEEIYCDKLRLNQVLLNLVSNSVKYTGAGGTINIRITEKAGAPEGYANYVFYIRDTGIGMSEQFVKHIFEPFEREDNTAVNKIQGAGLGMAITKNIVDMMNGSIEVKSEQGVGSEFTLSFMFRLHCEAKEPQEIPELKNHRALVVDDDFNTCDSVSYMLGQLGMRAGWTLSGKEAVLRTHQALVRGDEYCLYIIDWLLPDMNGVEVARRIRSEMGKDVWILILTAYDWTDIEEEAKEAGVTAFCSKPLFLSELRNCLRRIIDNGQEKEKDTAVTAVSLQGGRILLAEDIELNQEIAEVLLGDAGFSVEVAENGQVAVEMLKKSEPGYYKLILMDIQMPIMNGYEAAMEIRRLANPELASIPIIAMTANAFEEDKQEALKCGMNGHIAKPIDVDALFATLEEILGEA